LVGSIWKLRLK